jgi:outer membrane protein OmpA-like peptidoglycan-associated protein
MKALLIVTGIILISFQINRIFISNTDGGLIRSEVKILDENFTGNEPLPAIDSTYRSARSIKKAAAADVSVAAVEKTVEAVATKAVAKTTVKARRGFAVSFSAEKNNNFKMLHRLIKETKTYQSFTTVQFDFNKYDALSTEAFNEILQYADRLMYDSSLKVSIAGFADSIGSSEYNEQLSWMRANDIKKYMTDLGVDEGQIIISANGSADPVASNATVDGRSENRRVELALVKS